MDELLLFYALDYEGEMPEQLRPHYLKRAAALLNAMVNPCPALRLEQNEALHFAICAAADALYAASFPNILKEENGDLKLTYAAKPSATEKQSVAQAAYPYLCGTGLLYCGVRKW